MPSITIPTKSSGSDTVFQGYYGSSSGGTQYYNKEGKSARNWDIDGNTTLYAIWSIPTKEYWEGWTELGSSVQTLTNTTRKVTSNTTINSGKSSRNALTISGTVTLYIKSGVTLTVYGADGSGTTGGGAAIKLESGNTIIVRGGGKIVAYGGKAGNGGNGSPGGGATTSVSGAGGNGGAGGGAGAGIGSDGGAGKSAANNGAAGISANGNGSAATAGSGGSASAASGTLNKMDSVTITATGGAAGSSGTPGDGGASGASGTAGLGGGGGGGGGTGGGSGANIGKGGSGGGNGGGGSGGYASSVLPVSAVSYPGSKGDGTTGGAGGIVIASTPANGGTGASGGSSGSTGGSSSAITPTTTYTITYNGNGGDLGAVPSTGKKYQGVPYYVTDLIPLMRTGYNDFLGWSTSSTATTATYTAANLGTNPYTADAATTLYAIRAANTYTVKFHANDPGGSTSMTGSMTNQSHTYAQTKALTSNTFNKPGYTFTGWNTQPDGTGTAYTNSQSVSNLTADNGAVIDLYAQWKPNECTVTFDANGGTGSMDSIKFNFGTEERLAANTFTRTGYTFSGWNTVANGSGTAYLDGQNFILTTSTGSNVTLYAQWTANKYGVFLNAPQADKERGTDWVSATFDAAMPGITMPERTGYTFQGYYASVNNAATGAVTGTGTQYYKNYAGSGASNTNWNVANDSELFAAWTPNTYTVTLNQQSGSGGSGSVTATYDANMPSMGTKPTRTGYTFYGYYTGVNGTGEMYYDKDGNSARAWGIAENTTLYAFWSAQNLTVSLNPQGGSGGTTSVLAKTGSPLPSITPPIRPGYTFGGYYTEPSGGTQYYDASGKGVNNWPSASGGTLYAKWTADTGTPFASVTRVVINEKSDNSGALADTQTIILTNGKFETNVTKAMVTVSNLPAGLDFAVNRDGDNSITITFSGKATNHAAANSVANATVTIAAAAIGSGFEFPQNKKGNAQ